MKTLIHVLISIQIFFVFSSLAYAKKEFCMTLKPGVKVYRRLDKEKVSFPAGSRFVPLKKNKDKTYLLFKKDLIGYWVHVDDIRLSKEDKCEIEIPVSPIEEKKPQKLEEQEELVNATEAEKPIDKQEEEKVSETETETETETTTAVYEDDNESQKFKRFQARIGYSTNGDVSAGDGFRTKIQNPSDVRLEQDPVIQETGFDSSLELLGSYKWLWGSGLIRGSFGYRMTSIALIGRKNSSAINPKPESQLSGLTAQKVTYSSIQFGAEYGRVLRRVGDFKFVGYAGLDIGYRLSSSSSVNVLACPIDPLASCVPKDTPKTVTAELDQIVATPSLSIEVEYDNYLTFGLGIDMFYIPTIRIGAVF